MQRHLVNARAFLVKELTGCFYTPLAYVVIVAFLILSWFVTFYVSRFYEAQQADLNLFFRWLPWLYLLLIPALSMRLWAEERRTCTLELIYSMPVTLTEVVVGKFLAAWLIIGLALLLTLPLVLTAMYLGDPDPGITVYGYLGGLLMAGAYLGVGSVASACTRSQVISFVVSLVASLFLVLAGWDPVRQIFAGWLPVWLVDRISALGFVTRFGSMTRGVLDLKDILYFSLFIFASLCLNRVVLDTSLPQKAFVLKPRRTGRISWSVPSRASAFAILVLALLVASSVLSRVNLRWDLTEERIYSLSQGTKRILRDMQGPVTIRFFFSKSSPHVPAELKLFADRTTDYLKEFEYAGGEVNVETCDPYAAEEAQKWARKHGLAYMEDGEGGKIYSGLVLFSRGQEERIGWVDTSSEQTLEYEVSSRIQRLKGLQRKVIGIISNLPVFGSESWSHDGLFGEGQRGTPAWHFVRELSKQYEVGHVPLSADRIDPKIDLLILFHPKDLHPDLRYAVDEYTQRGGNSILFVDPSCTLDQDPDLEGRLMPAAEPTSALFSAWGISMKPGAVVLDREYASRSGLDDLAGGLDPSFFLARDSALNRSSPITANIRSVLLPMAGAIEKAEDSPYAFEPLIQSGEGATLFGLQGARGHYADPAQGPPAGGKVRNMAVLVRGKFRSAFPERQSDAHGAGYGEAGEESSGPKEASIIVVADADLLADRYCMKDLAPMEPAAPEEDNDNIDFLLNCCELLTGNRDLMEVRSRKRLHRGFDRIEELQRRARREARKQETEWVRRIEAARQRVTELERENYGPAEVALGRPEREELSRLKAEIWQAELELGETGKNLRRDVERLGSKLKLVNLLLMPVLVVTSGLAFAWQRRRKIKRG
jgi:ABC-type uncharacterized transport system involved in gliding motility auxiliary subunit/ABC-type transport system involved in multi-copper enzyme maturation permease subunit